MSRRYTLLFIKPQRVFFFLSRFARDSKSADSNSYRLMRLGLPGLDVFNISIEGLQDKMEYHAKIPVKD